MDEVEYHGSRPWCGILNCFHVHMIKDLFFFPMTYVSNRVPAKSYSCVNSHGDFHLTKTNYKYRLQICRISYCFWTNMFSR